MNRLFFILSLTLVLSSCKKGLLEEIVPLSLNVKDIGTVTVMDAKIEKDNSAWVQISYSEDINSPFSTTPVYEEKAIVEISNGTAKEQLNYMGKGIYTGKTIKGQVGINYTLSVKINNSVYTATSKMLSPATLRDITLNYKVSPKGGKNIGFYAENWVVNDPSAARNRYLFEWWTNGVHQVRMDWTIDDNRVVNAKEGLSLFNPTRDVLENEHTLFRVSEVDKSTYDYFNMYEKIVRGIASAGDQTPYNPASSFGPGTVGNFRAVAFSTYPIHAPPSLTITGQTGQTALSFQSNKSYSAYNLYWGNMPGITQNSNVINKIQFTPAGGVNIYTHAGLTPGTYYYKIEAEDAQGNKSVLSPEAVAKVK